MKKKFILMLALVLCMTFMVPIKAMPVENYLASTELTQEDLNTAKTELIGQPFFEGQKGEFRLGRFVPTYQFNGDNLELIQDSVQYPIYQNGKMKYMLLFLYPANERIPQLDQTYIVDPLADYVEKGNQQYFLVQLPTALFAVSGEKVQLITLTMGITADIDAMRDRVEYMEDSEITQAYENFLEESKKSDVGESSYAVIKKAAEDFGIPFIERLLEESRIDFHYNQDMNDFSSLPIILNNDSSGQKEVEAPEQAKAIIKRNESKKANNKIAPPTGDCGVLLFLKSFCII